MRSASIPWLVTALVLYLVVLLISTLRWKILLGTQHVHVSFGRLVNSYLVATFANNFLPSNIGGDVIRVADTARAAQSKTLATAVVLADRGVGARGPGVRGRVRIHPGGAPEREDWPDRTGVALGRPRRGRRRGGVRAALARSRGRDGQAASDLSRRMGRAANPDDHVGPRPVPEGSRVRWPGAWPSRLPCRRCWSGSTRRSPRRFSSASPSDIWRMLVPISFLVQMMPFSMNGHGVREWTFKEYLTRIGIAQESAVALSLIGATLVMLFSMSGAAAYLTRRGKDAGGRVKADLTRASPARRESRRPAGPATRGTRAPAAPRAVRA